MKKTIGGMVALAAMVALAGCNTVSSKLPKEEVAKVLPSAMCANMIRCMPQDGPTKDDCEKALIPQVLEGKDGQPFPSVTKAQLEACVVGLNKWTCEQMQNSPNPPAGCEFLAKKSPNAPSSTVSGNNDDIERTKVIFMDVCRDARSVNNRLRDLAGVRQASQDIKDRENRDYCRCVALNFDVEKFQLIEGDRRSELFVRPHTEVSDFLQSPKVRLKCGDF